MGHHDVIAVIIIYFLSRDFSTVHYLCDWYLKLLPANVLPLIKTDGQAERTKLSLLVHSTLAQGLLSSIFSLRIHISFSPRWVLFCPSSLLSTCIPIWLELIFLPASLSLCFKHEPVLLTGSGSLTDKGNELLFYFLHSVQIVHKKDVSVTGFAGDIHQLAVVCVRKANCEDDVAWEWN